MTMQSSLSSNLGRLCRAFAVAMALVATGTGAADDSRERDREHDGGGGGKQPKADFVIPMNYELGMHCTGFEFAYCCVLPPYNSILAQVIKTQDSNDGFAQLLEGDPNLGKDAILKRETVVRDPEVDGNGNFKKYVIRYRHEAQDRSGDPNGKPQTSTLISNAELNSLFMWNTVYDRTTKNANYTLKTGDYNNATNVPVGDGVYGPDDNYASGWLNHLYLYAGPDGPNLEGKGATGVDKDKIHLGIDVPIPVNCGPSLQPLGPVTTGNNPNDCAGFANGNSMTFSTDDGTVVYTKSKVLDDLPIMLTSPRIWEALGLPLTPFEDSIGFFSNDPASGPGSVDEDSIRPYVKMVAELHDYTTGFPVLDSKNNPVRAFGTAPIDIPNCERCHSELAATSFNSAQQIGGRNSDIAAMVEEEMNFWNAYYAIDEGAGDSTWYTRLKGAAISILAIHDAEHGTEFTRYYPAVDCVGPSCSSLTAPVAGSVGALLDAGDPRVGMPQNTRLGHESVICQKCHADNVIAVVKSANCSNQSGDCTKGELIPPVTQAIHDNHRSVTEGGVISFTDSLGRDGGCQGCHPAHRSDGDMSGYPITITGDNEYQSGDNRLASGGCFVGRDVHSNIYKDTDGAETPEHLNAVGQWLSDNVFDNQHDEPGGNQSTRGIWCTNCHTQLSQEIWKAENVYDLIDSEGICTSGSNKGQACKTSSNCGGGTCTVNNVRAGSLQQIADEVAGGSLALVKSWLDPKGSICESATGADAGLNGRNCTIDADCGNGMCVDKSYDGVDRTHAAWDPANEDANVAIVEVAASGGCSDGYAPYLDPTFGVNVCAKVDGEGDPNYRILDFCTTDDCVAAAQATLIAGNVAVAVPFRAATDARDHWLAPGEPHCADCHAAPYVEPSGGNIGEVDDFGRTKFRPPFNYPRKASLMRYSRGHRDITCQGCHESIHGLYPVTPNIDTTSYAQAAQWNPDDSHGPLKCGTCHRTDSDGIPDRIDELRYKGQRVRGDFDAAVSWAHTFTDDHDPRVDYCRNCHEDESDEVSYREEEWLEHAMKGRASRKTMDQVEILQQGFISGDPATQNPRYTVCRGCHDDKWRDVSCGGSDGRRWKEHLTEGRVSEVVWEYVSKARTNGSTCGW